MNDNPNLGWLFYRDMYNTRRKEKIKEKEIYFSFDYLAKEKGKPSEDQVAVMKLRSVKFFMQSLGELSPDKFFSRKNDLDEGTYIEEVLTTTYPGLLCGSGYNHGISTEADYKIGFYFDHTSGIPVIPGSAVKGVLRNAFPNRRKIEANPVLTEYEKGKELEQGYEFFKWLICEANENRGNIPEIAGFGSNDKIDELEDFIFDGIIWEQKDGKKEENYVSYYKRDVFFEAYPVTTFNKNEVFLGNDYITPHVKKDNPEFSMFTSPTPLQFLKILPLVVFKFQFKLTDCLGLSAEQKRLLFKQILCYSGVGAKTNVGYGQLVDKSYGVPSGSVVNIGKEAIPLHEIPVSAASFLKKDCIFEGVVDEIVGVYFMVEFITEGGVCRVMKNINKIPDIKVGDKVNVKWNKDYSKIEFPNFKVTKI